MTTTTKNKNKNEIDKRNIYNTRGVWGSQNWQVCCFWRFKWCADMFVYSSHLDDDDDDDEE